MSRQHAPCTDGCELRCIIHADESTVSKISNQFQIDTNERIKLETSIHICRKYKGTVRSICILHPILNGESQSVPGGEETLPAAQTT